MEHRLSKGQEGRVPLDFYGGSSKALGMDMSGSYHRVPDRCWIEFRDLDGRLLVEGPAKDDGACFSTELPVVPRGTIGTQHVCRETDGVIWREEPEGPEPLNDRAGVLFFIQYG